MTFKDTTFSFTNLIQAFGTLKENILNNINCIQIGIIEDFDSSVQTASVSITSKIQIGVSPITWADYPLLIDVPCLILGGGGANLQFPIQKGDECIILFNDRQLDNWFANGGVQPFTIGRTHDLSDGIAIVGIRSLPNSIQNYIQNGTKLCYNDTSIILNDLGLLINAPVSNFNGNVSITGDLLVGGSIVVDGGIW